MDPDMVASKNAAPTPLDSPSAFHNRELSWLSFAGRVIALVENSDLPLLERVKFAGIAGMLHDEFFMKRMSGLKRQIKKQSTKQSIDGRLPQEEYDACIEKLHQQGFPADQDRFQVLGVGSLRPVNEDSGGHQNTPNDP